MYIATVISKQWCRRFLEIWQWDDRPPHHQQQRQQQPAWHHLAELSEIIIAPTRRGWGEYCLKIDFYFLLQSWESQQMIGRQYSPKPSSKVVVELLRFYKKCDYYSWQYIAVLDDQRCSPGGFLFSFHQLSSWFETFSILRVHGKIYA